MLGPWPMIRDQATLSIQGYGRSNREGKRRKTEPFLLEPSLSLAKYVVGEPWRRHHPSNNGAHPMEVTMPQGTASPDHLRVI